MLINLSNITNAIAHSKCEYSSGLEHPRCTVLQNRSRLHEIMWSIMSLIRVGVVWIIMGVDW